MTHQTVHKCMFPAAGFGTRFLPASKSVPKEMLPVVNTPLIHFAVEEAMLAGIDGICIVYGRHKEALINYFDRHVELEDLILNKPAQQLIYPVDTIINRCRFTFTRQREMRGLGDAIFSGKELIGDEPFAVALADDLCFGEHASPLQDLLKVYQAYGTSVVLVEDVAPDKVDSYGIVMVDDPSKEVMQVHSMVEKPAPGTVESTLGIIGRYILTPDIFTIIADTARDARGEVQLTDALAVQAAQGRLRAVRFHGQRFDCGQIHGMVDATNYVYRNMRKTPLTQQ